MKRREFLNLTVPATGAVLVSPGFINYQMQKEINEQFSDTPSIDKYDVIINGAGLSGYFAALEAARQGRSVLLVEKRTTPGYEITAKQKLWIGTEGFDLMDSHLKRLLFPEGEKDEIINTGGSGINGSQFGDELSLFAGSIKKGMLRNLLQEQVHVLLMTDVCGILSDGESVNGVLLACKHGLYTVNCNSFVDCSDNVVFSRNLTGTPYYIEKAGFVMEVLGSNSPQKKEVNVPEGFGLCDQKIQIHRGKHLADQVFVEYDFPVDSQNIEEIEHQSRIIAAKISKNFAGVDHSLIKAKVENFALESTIVLKDKSLPDNLLKGYFLLTNDPSNLTCGKLVKIEKDARKFVSDMGIPKVNSTPKELLVAGNKIPIDQLKFSDPNEPGLSIPLKKCDFRWKKWTNNRQKCQVVVAGGGTSGAMAAMGSVEKSANTIVVDYFNDLGGTKTMGGVMGYYHGYKENVFFKKQDQMATQVAYDHSMNSNVGRRFFHLQEVLKDGGRFLPGAIMCGTLVNQKKVEGILICRNGKLELIEANITIDATGDGDLAAFAGASFNHGDSRTGMTQDYSQWDQKGGAKEFPSATGRDYDIIDNTKISELQRGLFLSHYYAHFYDFYPMLTVRESRRIEGLYTPDLIDSSEGTHFKDMMSLASSDFDPHAIGSSEYSKCGFLLPHSNVVVVEIPYRSIVPKGLDGMLISGRGISQTHNALQFTRMSADLAVLGYLTGQVAADQVWNKIEPKDYDISRIQKEWQTLGYLTEEFMSKQPGNLNNEDSEVNRRVNLLSQGQPEYLYECVKLPRSKAVPILKAYFRKPDANKLLLAKALAWFGEQEGNDLIIGELEKMYVQELEEGYPNGYVDTYDDIRGREKNMLIGLFWRINQNIGLLAMAKNTQCKFLIKRILENTESGGGLVERENQYFNGRIDLKIIPYFNRIMGLCFYVERVPDPIFVSGFRNLLKDKNIGGFVTDKYHDTRWRVYGGGLELNIGAALSRCGAKEGYGLLLSYLDDIHYNFKNFARQELSALTNKDYSFDTSAWKKYLAKMNYPRPVVKLEKEVEV
ncbi:MAG: FAD-dependent oxidoreductase [Cyclobacteriaceae bacterium]